MVPLQWPLPPWSALAGQLRLVAAGLSRTARPAEITPRPFGIKDHLDAALASLDRIAPLDARPTYSSGPGGSWTCGSARHQWRLAVSTTTAADLVSRADLLLRELRNSTDPVSLAEWESFDVTAYRLLHQMVGPGGTRNDRTAVLAHAALVRVLAPATFSAFVMKVLRTHRRLTSSSRSGWVRPPLEDQASSTTRRA